ncbi:sigma-70 family RNA polymerase sigma factor [Rhodoplanes sp. Z2-YC6860]|uniref:sigma-70 family RNA polymerase sigma factor n=1 Tax=Rhodoplanes sp. Z2-YC6860 TaxID=674703 RepID=UPI00078D3EB7|nr:sigma-70 family RNA polymerase sigma factor [Rhodoplanes sp. Z2-YC6860]AMN40171.1 RNA polymerase, sigma-24 subunit, ECF subfamily [Rhodoplanes sp. Z2-YC6860]
MDTKTAITSGALNATLERVAEGDRTALQALYRQTSAKLFGVCLRILRERAEAQDVLQEVYVTVWRRACGYDPARGSAIAWLVTIARNKAIDRIRATPSRGETLPIEFAGEVCDPSADPYHAMETAEQGQRLSKCLDGLAAQHSDAIRAAFLDGETYETLAHRASVPLGTMKSWIRRSLIKLKACLER